MRGIVRKQRRSATILSKKINPYLHMIAAFLYDELRVMVITSSIRKALVAKNYLKR